MSCIPAVSISHLIFCSLSLCSDSGRYNMQTPYDTWAFPHQAIQVVMSGCETLLTVYYLVIHLSGLFPLGVIAAVVFVLICLLVVMVRYIYRHKGTYHTNEAKGTEFAESADAALKNDPALQEAVDESKKEYFI